VSTVAEGGIQGWEALQCELNLLGTHHEVWNIFEVRRATYFARDCKSEEASVEYGNTATAMASTCEGCFEL
jgi:hypothetical protein